jgi:tRNA (guanine37-N1)-methyltransferase
MRFDLITIFPDFFAGPLDYGIVRRAREARLIETHVHDLRNFTHDRHRTVDDRPFGGGEGMVMKPEPLFEAVESLLGKDGVPPRTAIVLLSATGKLFRQGTARRFSALDRIVLICGRYEGVDERVAEHLATDEICVGDFVLSGGELAAAMILDAVTRLIPGALGNEDSAVNESFSAGCDSATESAPEKIETREGTFSNHSPLPGNARELRFQESVGLHRSPNTGPRAGIPVRGPNRDTTRHCLLDFPHYTRPQSFRGWDVPEVLMSGNHEEIRRWRRAQAIEKTRRNRPDLLSE